MAPTLTPNFTSSVQERHAASAWACCEACAANPECKSFTFYRPSKYCRLKGIKDTLNCGPLTGDPTNSACANNHEFDSGFPIIAPSPPPSPPPVGTCGPGTVLNEATSQCEILVPAPPAPPPPLSTPGIMCDIAEHRRGTAAYVHTASIQETHAASSMACCEACAANPECKSFVFYRPSKSCRLKAIKDTLNCGPLTGDPTDSACLAHGDDRNYDSGSPILLARPPPLPLPSAPSVTCGPGTVLNEATSQCESQGTEAEVFETWVKAEMAKPPTLHREYYRQRSNPQARDGAVDQSCNSTTWSRNTFTLRDVYRSAEVTNVRHARQAPSFPILEDCLDSC